MPRTRPGSGLTGRLTIIKQAIAFHSRMAVEVPGFYYGDATPVGRHPYRGLITERGLKHVIACVEAMKDVLGNEIGLALDCGPGWTVPDAIRWLERWSRSTSCGGDLITGDYSPAVLADVIAT